VDSDSTPSHEEKPEPPAADSAVAPPNSGASEGGGDASQGGNKKRNYSNKKILGFPLLDALQAFFDASLVATAIIGSVFIYRQLGIMQAQLYDARIASADQQIANLRLYRLFKNQSDSLATLAATNSILASANIDISHSAKSSAKAAKASATNSGKALSAAEKHFQISLKPVLTHTGIYGNGAKTIAAVFNSKTATTLYVFIKNVGQSPASVREFACVIYGGHTPPFDVECPRAPYEDTHIYGVGDEHFIEVPVGPFSEDHLSEFKNGKRQFRVFAGAAYVDQFGNSYHYSSCKTISLGGEGPWLDCPEQHYIHEAKQGQPKK